MENRARTNLARLVRENDWQNLPQAAAKIPWGHNIVLIEKLKDPAIRQNLEALGYGE